VQRDYKILDDLDFNNKKVLVRAGFDVPVDENGEILDDKRILLSIPTIKYLLDKNAKQIILCWHMGRPKERTTNLTTKKVSELLSKLLTQPVEYIDNWGENGLSDTKIIALENLRFNPNEKSKSEEEKDNFGKQLSSLVDIFIQDAFSNCHRNHASMTSIPKFIPGCVGKCVQNELDKLKTALTNPEKPLVAIFGGMKADKINAIKNLLRISDNVLVAGGIAALLLETKGYYPGASKVDKEGLDLEKIKEIANNPKIKLPVDYVLAEKFDNSANIKIETINNIPKDWYGLDIGPETIKEYTKILETAKTILWFGPIGVFEMENFAKGTKEIAKFLKESNAVTIIGGGDSANAVDSLGYSESMTLVSSGGGASLQIIEGKELPAITALKKL
jgi:3-phosphoglycerate kinase